MPDVENISAVKYAKYEYVSMMSGSRMGVCSVNLVVNEAIMPNMMPISTPPMAVKKNEETPRAKSMGSIFSCPMPENPSNMRYKTFKSRMQFRIQMVLRH